MCRLLGAVARAPISLGYELLEAPNPLIRQAESHDSGFGIAVYRRPDGSDPGLVRFPQAGSAKEGLRALAGLRGQIFNAHVRRATVGGLRLENTHPFAFGVFTFSHNGTLARYPRLPKDAPATRGDTDSERLFARVLAHFDGSQPVRSLRRALAPLIDETAFSALNFLLCDGERLYAYRLGVFELHWWSDGERLLLASERLTAEHWRSVQQDVLLIADPSDPTEPAVARVLGDDLVARARIERLEPDPTLSGEARGVAAEQRAQGLAAAPAG